MTAGEIVDFIQEWNARQKKAEKEEKVESNTPKKKYRLATPQEAAAYHRG